jgi:spore germination cell wall hydrolase CwlJ-like protein
MRIFPNPRRAVGYLALALVVWLGACGSIPRGSRNSLACMSRAMYFESVRSSDEGMLAVGTVVMNRVESKQFPNSVCSVVGQKNQFAAGVLSRPMKEGRSKKRAERVARAVLRGKRHSGVQDAKYFHTAGRTYRYSNMHYLLVAGGNAFYTRSPRRGQSYIPRRQIAMAGPRTSLEAPRGRQRREIASPGYLVAMAPTPAPAPRPQAPAEITIEQLIVASAGW